MNWAILLAAGLLGGAIATTTNLPGAQGPLAPDGRPGLGTERTAHEISRLFASPGEEQLQLLQALNDLPSDVLIRREMVRRWYRELGYFSILERTSDQNLEDLHERYQQLNLDAMGALMSSSETIGPFLQMFLDQRFRLRLALFDTFDLESVELRKGLRLLSASQDGFYDLRDSEAKNIASRVDLAAAALRAIRLDLDALRETGTAGAPGAPDPAWMAELIGITKVRGERDRLRSLEVLREKLGRRLERLESSMFWPRLKKKVSVLMDKRASYSAQANEHLERTRQYLLLSPFDEEPNEEIRAMSQTDRFRYAMSEAVRGVTADPLNEELTYLTGVTTERFYSPHESRMWFDRYLALRGIRSQDIETTRGRQLTPEEENALQKVLQAHLGGLGR
jgi:hypothetical protein